MTPPKRPPYNPQGSCREVWRSQSLEVLTHGPTRSGKTRGWLEKCLLAAFKYPGSRQLIVRQTRASMTETVLETLENHVLPVPCTWKGKVNRRFRTGYDLPNGASIVIAGMDNPDRIMGAEYDRIYVSEGTEFREDQYQPLITRLSGSATPYRQIIVDCNPVAPTHWLYQRMQAGVMQDIASTHKDNPRFWDAKRGEWTADGIAYREMLGRSLSGHRRARLLEGRWVSAEGIVYPEFEPALHVIDAMPPGWEAWPKYRSIDLGYSNPFVCQWWALDHDGRMYLYREIYRTQITIDEHAAEVKRLSGTETYRATVCDHDAGERALLERAGIPTVKAIKKVEGGINAVRARLVKQSDGRPRIYFLRTASTTIDRALADGLKPVSTVGEFDCYAFASTASTRLKEEPIKEHDHGMDAMRYAVMHLDSQPAAVPYVSRLR